MKISEVLYKAADVMERRGFAQETYEDERGRVCMLAAVSIAEGGPTYPDNLDTRAIRSLSQVTGKNLYSASRSVADFNNDTGMRKCDAVAALLIAADIAAAEGK